MNTVPETQLPDKLKNWSGTNALAYFESTSVAIKKGLTATPPGGLSCRWNGVRFDFD